MTTYIVSRHSGAVEWIRQRIHDPDCRVISHLDGQRFQPGDRVCGVLTLALAAGICEDGAEACVISVDLPPHMRGQELSARQLDEFGARLVRYQVTMLSVL